MDYMNVVYGLIILWILFSVFYILKLWNSKSLESINPYIFNSIPNVFTTIGVLGTFVGIYFGLLKFDVNEITASIPTLLTGLKTAF